SESAHLSRNMFAIRRSIGPRFWTWSSHTMTARSLWARLAVSLAAIATLGLASARADVLHATYRVSLIGLPIGAARLNAELSPTSYSIEADAKLTGLAKIISNAQGASTGQGAIVDGRISPATFATIAASPNITRTIR